MSMKNIAADPVKRKVIIMGAGALLGMFVMPHDQAVATMASTVIFPAVAAGIGFGIAIMSAIDVWNAYRAKKAAGDAQKAVA